MHEPSYLDEMPSTVESVSPHYVAAPTNRIDFSVTMKHFVSEDLTGSIVSAAADQALRGAAPDKLREDIKKRIAEGITERIDAVVVGITKSVLDEPVTGSWSRTPTTMRDMLQLAAKDYLFAKVSPADGRILEPDSYSSRNGISRLEYITKKTIAEVYDTQLKTAVAEMQKEVRASVKAAVERLIEEQKAIVREALAKIVKP